MGKTFEDVTIKLVRHGESEGNAGVKAAWQAGDHRLGLTESGREHARAAGRAIGAAFVRDALVYVSPYTRTRETLAGVLEGAECAAPDALRWQIYEDPQIREVEFGYSADASEKRKAMAPTHGWFYYRPENGESAADCYDRVASFIESMSRQVQRKGATNVLVVSHGLTIRCFVMRFLHLKVELFEEMANPGNGDVITISRNRSEDRGPFSTPRWKVDGLRARTE